MKVEQLLLDHLQQLDHVAGARAILQGGWFQDLVCNGPTYAGLTNSGQVIAAMGMLKQNTVSYRCWAVCDEKLLPLYLLPVCKLMRRTMDALYVDKGAKRIETIVRDGNDPAHRWIKVLGFSNPLFIRHFDEHGDAWLYERLASG
jgi:hypothetical protein